MTHFRTNHPYDPRYALPVNVMAEAPGRGGVLTTQQAPRGTFSSIPRGWTGGYAVPDYVKREPHKRGAMHTYWERRKTIPTRVRESLGDLLGERELDRMLERGEPVTLTLPQEVYALDGDPELPRPGFRGDPVAAYGRRASEFILRTIREVPVEFRWVALEALLNEVEPELYDRVTRRANQYKKSGMTDKRAVKAALASSMSEGIAREIVTLGRGRAPSMRSQFGLGFYGDAAVALALSGLWGSIKRGVKKVGRTVKRTAKRGVSATRTGVRLVGKKASWPARKTYQGIRKGAGYVKKGAQKAYQWGKKTVSKLGSLACGVVKSPAAPMAAGAAAGAYGAPPQAGAVGAQIGAALCSKSETPSVPQEELMQPQQYARPGWVLPVALGGAGILAALLVTRKRGSR